MSRGGGGHSPTADPEVPVSGHGRDRRTNDDSAGD
jgi:hypothetical protein